MAISLLLISVAMIALSGVPGLFFGRRTMVGQWIAVGMNVIGSALGAAGLVIQYLHPELSSAVEFGWALPVGRFAAAVDDLSAVFLVPMLVISAAGAIYGLGYWKQSRHPGNGRKLRLFWGIMTAGMMGVVLARDGVLFLVAWEFMALAAFFLVTTEDRKPAVRRVGWIYLVATHVGTLCLLGFFALLRYATGSFSLWQRLGDQTPAAVAIAIFVLGAIGFGLKAGLMPLHVWLPGAHANAPSHVSAILSGVLLKTGVYGLVRLGMLLEHPPIWWGAVFLIAGSVSAIVGIAYAAGQRDFKRLLAYSSIENIGIITIGLGLGLVGRSVGRMDLVVLGMGGALLHVLNHSLFKPLLFMGAGAVVHSARTREIDLLGGLGQRMPRTAALFFIGAIAICGLPPLNGFVSELFIYIGLFKSSMARDSWIWVALAAPALALVGSLALGAFVKLFGVVFGGTARTAHSEHAHDPGAAMIGPMVVLAAGCVWIGILPGGAVAFVCRAAGMIRWTGAEPSGGLASYVPLWVITTLSAGILVISAMVGLWVWKRSKGNVRTGLTWDCGYARPTARMQYGGSSLSQMIVDLFSWILVPRRWMPKLRRIFPGSSKFRSEVPDVVLDRSVVPAFGVIERLLATIKVLQRGTIQVYLLYVLATLLFLLLWA